MTAPDVSLYDRAVLDPQNNFGDPELRAARVMITKTGAPASWGGNFASVYLLESGGRRIALRCFLKELEGQERHYASIAREFNSSTSPFAVDFVFLPKGIRIRDQWLPIIKMQWIDGQLLDEFTGHNLTKPERFKYLANKYLEMSRLMRANGIAHGDLNPSNIFVFNRSFKLIDYDAMFVPSLSGYPGCESGLRLYQHPNRHRNHFGPYIDNFSDWIHYTTLLVYSVEPSLFAKAGLPNEYALFQYSDYVNPGQSQLFRYLKEHDNTEIRGLAIHIERLLAFPVEHVPVLDPARIHTGEVVIPPSIARVDRAEQAWADRRGEASAAADHIKGSQQRSTPLAPPQQQQQQQYAQAQNDPSRHAAAPGSLPQHRATPLAPPQQQQLAQSQHEQSRHAAAPASSPQQRSAPVVPPQQPLAQPQPEPRRQGAREATEPPSLQQQQQHGRVPYGQMVPEQPQQFSQNEQRKLPQQPISPLGGTVESEENITPVFTGGLAGIDRSGRNARNPSSAFGVSQSNSAFGSSHSGSAFGGGGGAADAQSSAFGGRRDSSAFGGDNQSNASDEIAATDPRRAEGGLGAGLSGAPTNSSYRNLRGNTHSEPGGGSGASHSSSTYTRQRVNHESLMPSVGLVFGGTIAVGVLQVISTVITALAPKNTSSSLVSTDMWGIAGMVIGFLSFIAWIFAGIQFMTWLNKAYRNLQNCGIYGTKFGGTAFMVTLFIPIASCIVPYLTMQELAKASKPNEGPNTWNSSSSSPLVFGWAFVWFSAGVTAWFLVYLAQIAEPDQATLLAQVSSALSTGLTLVAAVLCGLMVKNISEMQEQKFARELSNDVNRSGGDAAGVLGLLTMVGLGVAPIVAFGLMCVAWITPYMTSSEAETALGEKDYKKAISICQRSKGYAASLTNLRVLEAKSYAGMKDYKNAIEIYDEIVRTSPSTFDGWNGRGETKMAMNKNQDAIADFDKAIELDKTNSSVFSNKAKAELAMKQYPKALEDVDKAIELDSEKAYPRFLKAMILFNTNKYEDALALFEEAAKLDNSDGPTFYNMAACYQKVNRLEEATENYELAAEKFRAAGDESSAVDAEKRIKMLAKH